MLDFFRRKPGAFGLTLTAAVLQLLLLWRAFGPLFAQPGQFIFVDEGDGAKNYYTFQAYLQQPWEQGLRWFAGMNYPFGDYIFYTDNSPLLAAAVKLFSRYVYDVTPYGLDVYHGLVLSGMVFSTVLLVSLLRPLLRAWGLVLAFSVLLPWLSPQLSRLTAGHFNLALSWVVLLGIWGTYQLYTRTEAGQSIRRPVLLVAAGLTLAGFIHLYYLPIVGLYTGSFLAWWLLRSGRWRQGRLLAGAAAVTVLPVVLCYATIRLLDGYFALRLATPSGFNYAPWRLSLAALLQPYPYEKARFIIEPEAQVSYEAKMYLGTFALFGLLLLLLAVLRQPARWKQRWQEWRGTTAGRWAGLALGAATVGLLAALGTRFALGPDWYVNNYLSAFVYLQKISGSAAHFRAFARFAWPFFWALNLGGVLLLDYWLSHNRHWWRWAVALGLVLLAWLDTRDTLKAYRRGLLPNALTNVSRQPELTQLLRGVDVRRYQAILPIPYYHVGSENMDLTVDGEKEHNLRSYQLALRTGLPLMASRMSRTAPVQAEALASLFEQPTPDAALLAKLRGQSVLVFYDEGAYQPGRTLIAFQDRPRRLLSGAPGFITRQQLPLVAQFGTLRLYRWDVK
ncbi:hypothetical protein EJV47_19475 [Hymenobacter gummosus]|uniref:DUF6311 domain-containing protein n=1 Tax=Hymenobacter gummosus TaxID=1776032 RepID=A0A431TZ17_9BACT|nr:hypothetical protein [Hymenobacter gummosus]RTQ47597.1 hypothetical protein EJV47_19475 [Hymenobacter gummosus]